MITGQCAEADGAPYDSSYVSLLRQYLRTAGDSCYVMNAGICGSDPFSNYVNLRDRLLIYQPDMILQSIGSDDMTTDIVIRGGMERFQKDGTAKYHKAPWWEPIYALSYVSRIFFKLAGYNELLRKPGISPEENDRINKSVEDLFDQYSALCRKNGIRLLVVWHPKREEMMDNKYHYDFTPLQEHLKKDSAITMIDLLPAYQTYISQRHRSIKDYFWKYDGHHNSLGYQMMAATTLDCIRPYLVDSSTTTKK
jgi:lysophospholipase L1-like esterase